MAERERTNEEKVIDHLVDMFMSQEPLPTKIPLIRIAMVETSQGLKASKLLVDNMEVPPLNPELLAIGYMMVRGSLTPPTEAEQQTLYNQLNA
ncbi:hypothetical protein HN592_05720 [Candidatus Woesearchaeota archaeon]|jgi:hypothetical protein|nr:hypothetical protein [Candidatus Woesearchaeota archaeon]MBT3304754.1 hypothetical protein [Candidatus Woesearchaeota archaeon]MBT4367910.1 hypothetical protein [Candidatus Woesearchaeota archaeon]MBT4712398.1 hypothetical protein [Candidatus Woesearchaeota archaeon]MBT6639310.1 hypothetical protein [Candidatus Woesearchaeota archaeon]